MRLFARVLVVSCILASPATAQSSTVIELGIDASVGYGLDSPHVTTLGVPVRRLRVGFATTPVWSVEPFTAITHTSAGGGKATGVGVGVGALYHFGTRQSRSQPYVRPFVVLDHNKVSSNNGSISDSFTTFAAGGGVGVKLPIDNRLAWRLEASASHGFAHGSVRSTNELRAYAGVSFFTR